MSQRGARMTEFEERDYYAAPRRSNPRFEDDRELRTTRVVTRSPPPTRERESDRTPAFLREDHRRAEAGPMILRQRDVETWDRHVRSPSPVPVREERLIRRPRSESPQHFHEHDHEHSRTRVVERERERIRSPSIVRRRSPSPQAVRFVERRQRSPSPVREHIHTRIVEREREREPSPSPSPPPPPPTIRGPVIEREIITHYTDIDHGVIRAKAPSPPPPPRPRAQTRERETDIDISLSKNRTEVDVDIRRSASRNRSRSRERRSHYHDDEIVLRRDMDRLRVDDRHSRSHRRSHSAAPITSPNDDEAEYITSKIDSRGRIGEAYHGATKDWTIVDVPPGTEKVRMDGVGGATTETNWSKYSGVRRTKFIPERDGALVPARQPSPMPSTSVGRDHTSVTLYDREKEIDVDVEIERRKTRTPAPPPPPPSRDMWTEITKDLVCREAIEEMGYRYEETKWFFYIMDYLKYDEVLHLTELSARIRRHRRRYKEAERERDYMDDWYRRSHRHYHDHRPHHRQGYDWEWDDERVRETEVIYDSRGPARGYYR
ncbi:hypothetical protein QQS21_012922 [Conoideocrella luteorostrata]|uniref:DUF8035 domain-containing protein n=1 Tax=Conoideocrella luteorostrata TaxID=1105319 RepID=A0AAJ0CD03_9HYPO|nr:hypothetical protein QQS21_012922 [Conoideocrella luteorostrata]